VKVFARYLLVVIGGGD